MDTDNRTNDKLSRRTVLSAGIAALATAGSASPFFQQPSQQQRRGVATGPNRDTTTDELFKTPSEPANTPMGVGKGIHPGRVTWVHQPKATSWDGKTGNWWDDTYTDPRLVDEMVSESVRLLAGDKSDKQAWLSLFQQFNETHNGGKAGYRPGEKLAIKANGVQDRPGDWRKGAATPSPHVLYALVEQLIKVAGVRGEDITMYDASRYVGDPIYKRIKANPDPNFQAVRFMASERMAGNGRLAAVPDKANPIHFSREGVPTAYPPQCVTEAKYLINVGLLRAHTLMGVTLTAKNHFGSIYFDGVGFSPRPLHDYASRDLPMGSYNCLVDLIAHNHIGGKTLLYMVDGIYASEHNLGGVIKYQSLGDHWASSLFMSQDPVAIDSVGLDFVRNEPNNDECRGKPENYLHEAALADKPPSGSVYDSDRDGKPVTSLGVHEHWNNATDKQYSRNLGKHQGIELVAWPKPSKTQKA
jgi:uncharacterized protein (DUF362 family)